METSSYRSIKRLSSLRQSWEHLVSAEAGWLGGRDVCMWPLISHGTSKIPFSKVVLNTNVDWLRTRISESPLLKSYLEVISYSSSVSAHVLWPAQV